MLLSDLLADFRSTADDTVAPHLWPDPDVIRWFREAEEEACIRSKLLRGIVNYPVVANDDGAAVAAHIFEVRRAWLRDSAGTDYPIEEKDELELDRLAADWRTRIKRPCAFVWYADGNLRFDAVSDASYTLFIEGYALPQNKFQGEDESPSIPLIHHRRLVSWALYRAFSVPDADLRDEQKAGRHYAQFEAYFGRRPMADLGRSETANNPQVNKLW